MARPSLAKDFHRLIKRIGRLTDGQAGIDGVDWEGGDLNSFTVTIRPNASFYQNGRFKFKVRISEKYDDPPCVRCETDIYHPNIDRDERNPHRSNVCLDILEPGTWNYRTYGLESVVIGLLFLMHNPNVYDSLTFLADDFREVIGQKEFAKNVKYYMAGKAVNGITYAIDFRVIDGVFVDLILTGNNDFSSPSREYNAKYQSDFVGKSLVRAQDELTSECVCIANEMTCKDDEISYITNCLKINLDNGRIDSRNEKDKSKTKLVNGTDSAIRDEIDNADKTRIDSITFENYDTLDGDDDNVLPVNFVPDEDNFQTFCVQYGGLAEPETIVSG